MLSKASRWTLTGLFFLSAITYLDRAAMSSAIAAIRTDLGFDDKAAGVVFSAFAFGYALAQVPAGALADRFGPRLMLASVVIVWSLFTALTGTVNNLAVLIAVRALFGIAEAGAFPGAARAIANWLPPKDRGFASGVLFSGSRAGAALAFPLLVSLQKAYGWRISFGVLGLIGIAWAIVWWLLFRDHPPGAARVESRTHSEPRTKWFSPQLGLAMVQYFAENFTFFICMSWMLPWLQQRFTLTPEQAAGYSMAPLLAGGVSHWFTGWLVDRLYRSDRWRSWSRRLPSIIGFLSASVGLVAAAYAPDPLTAVVLLSAAVFGADMTVAPSWAFCADIGGKNTAAISGAMNMVGNFGSVLSGLAFPWLLALTGTPTSYFVAAALLNLVAVACWLRMKSV